MLEQPQAPVQPDERLVVIDILRGFALFGILVVNMIYFAHPIYRGVIDLSWASSIDRAAELVIKLFAEGKFFTMFSFLFGLGLAIQLQRAAAKGARFTPLYVRRLLVLLMFGLMHALLFWWGDILTYYATLGGVLLLFRNTAPRRLLMWALIFLVVPLVLNAAVVGITELARTTPEGAAQIEASLERGRQEYLTAYDRALAVYSGSSFTAMIPQRVADWSLQTVGVVFNGLMFVVLTMFMLGLYVGRQKLLHESGQHLALFRRVLLWGVILGGIGNVLYVVASAASDVLVPTWTSLAAMAGYVLGMPALSLAYAAGLVLLIQRPAWRQRLLPLAAVGRLALSNYLLQTLVCTTIFYGYGLGLYGQVGPAVGLVLTLVIFGLQIPLSIWWLRLFRFGPAEWLWRSLTYRRMQPMRVATLGGPMYRQRGR
jgi:uncharacterized protein